MSESEQAQLRITAWPAAPLPLPEVVKVESTLDRDDGVILPRAQGPFRMTMNDPPAKPFTVEGQTYTLLAPTPVRPDGETYLRLNKVDLDDPEEIFAFASQYGTLAGLYAYRALVTDGPIGTIYGRDFAPDAYLDIAYRGQLDPETEWEKKVRAVWRESRRGDPSLAFWDGEIEQNPDGMIGADPDEVAPYLETLEEFRFAARCLRDITAAWQLLRSGRDASELEMSSISIRSNFRSIEDPTFLLGAVLTRFLAAFHPQLTWRPLGQISWRATQVPAVRVESKRAPGRAPLFAVCALELYNHIVTNVDYHVCGNENCQRQFVHQQGRAETAQRRSHGVLYCSPECARAKAQREYRRRRFKREPEKS
jgi:hypothetical protein